LDDLENSYKKEVEILRKEIKIAEGKKNMEKQREKLLELGNLHLSVGDTLEGLKEFNLSLLIVSPEFYPLLAPSFYKTC